MKFRLLLIFIAFTAGISAQKKDSKNKQSKSIDSLTKKMTQNKGLITTYLNEENKLFFEIDSLILNKDLLVVTRIAQIPANYSPYSNAGSKTAQQVIRFSKKGNKILWKQVSFLVRLNRFLFDILLSTCSRDTDKREATRNLGR